jgi:hypothetical protein
MSHDRIILDGIHLCGPGTVAVSLYFSLTHDSPVPPKALKDSPHLDLLSPHLGTMIHLIQQVSVCSPSLLSESVGLLGDLWAVFGTQVEDHISRQVLMRFLEQCEEHVDSSVLAYVMNEIQRSTEAADNEMNTDE